VSPPPLRPRPWAGAGLRPQLRALCVRAGHGGGSSCACELGDVSAFAGLLWGRPELPFRGAESRPHLRPGGFARLVGFPAVCWGVCPGQVDPALKEAASVDSFSVRAVPKTKPGGVASSSSASGPERNWFESHLLGFRKPDSHFSVKVSAASPLVPKLL
jgi:hypothetical protein